MRTIQNSIEQIDIEKFADRYGLIMEIHERAKLIGHTGRYYAHFRDAEVREGSLLIGVFGDGSTPREAITNYAREISLRNLIIDAMGEARREIPVPRLYTECE